MKKSFKILLPLLALVLLAVFVLRPSPPPTVQQEPMSKQSIVQQLVNAYRQEGESDKLDDLLLQLSELDSSEAEKWRQILEYWKVTEKKMDIRLEQLPQGMDAGDGLCLIVLGYQLNPDGSMKEELIGRLETALSAADRYPQCRILCTGGGTASRNSKVTEADAMAQWLMEQGISESRLIVENQSLTTGQNAFLSYGILSEQYPEVTQIALISSDYHIPWAMLLFETQLLLSDSQIELVSHAAYPTGQRLSDAALLRYQANGLLELIRLNAETLAA